MTKKVPVLKKYTIIGYFDRDQRPWTEFVHGKDEVSALKNLHKQLTIENENGAFAALDQIWIVGVFSGWIKEVGKLEYTTRLSDMFEED